MIAVFAVVAMSAQASAAAAESAVARITGQWVTPPEKVTVGEPLVARWLVEVDAPQDATTSAAPLQDLTAELTLENGRFADIPEQCLVAGTDAPSELSEDGRTLSCNVGTKGSQTSAAIQTLVTADGPDGATVTGRGAIGDEEGIDLPPVTIVDPNAQEEPEATDPETTEPESTEPETTEPESTEPETTEPESTEPEAPADDEEAGAAAADDGAVTARAVNPPTTFVHAVTFYAYVGAGENIDVSAVRGAGAPAPGTATARVRGPGGIDVSCTIAATGAVPCAWSNLTSPTPAIWRIDITANTPDLQYLAYDIDVQSGATSIDGRVWTERYSMSQQNIAATADFSFWYQSEQGFLYRADYVDFNGVSSLFSSDTTGVAQLNTCTSAYESMDGAGTGSDTGRLWVPPAGQCGDPYKIFLEAPAADLPASATLWSGGSTWVRPPVVLPEVTGLAFAPDSASTRAGDFTFDVSGFTGQLEVQVDTNGDGDYTDAVDVRIPWGVAQDGAQTVAWNGLNGQGAAVSPYSTINARVMIDQAGEIHFANNDVERRGGLRVQALNGPSSGSTTLYWNDTALLPAGRIGTIPTAAQRDGRAGVDSSPAAGVHGWSCAVAACNTNTGNGGSWGDVRTIDDWTYQTIAETDEVTIPAGTLPPFECGSNAPGILYQTVSGATVSSVNLIDLATGQYTTPLSTTAVVNATGYNVADDYVYGFSDGELVRIGSNGGVDPMGIPLPGGSVVGDVDDNNHYWNYNVSTGQWIDVDLATGTSTSGTAVTPSPATIGGQDWAYIPGTDKLWRVAQNAAGTQSYLVGFDRSDHTWTTPVPLGNLGGAGSSNTVGAVFADADGFLYASYNATGQIYRVDVDAGTATFFAPGPSSAGNDGARCVDAPILIDFGDAVNGYGTTLASNGPRHGIPGHDSATNTAPLTLGSLIDPETDGVPGASTQGDDAAGIDDEDALAGPLVLTRAGPTTVAVAVTNTTGAAATLAGWVDLDADGVFEAGERATATVPAGATSADLTFPAGTAAGGTVARFRLFPGAVANPLPTGPAAAGEVEDHPATIEPVLPPPYPECDPRAFAGVGVLGGPSDWYSIDPVTGDLTLIESDIGPGNDISVNAIGYNIVDDRVYGVEISQTGSPWPLTGNVVVVGADGEAQRLGPVPGLQGVGITNVGDVSPEGVLHVTTGGPASPILRRIDVDPSSPGFLTMTQVTLADTDGDATNGEVGADWAFSPDGTLYSLRTNGQLVSVDPTTGEVDLVGPVTGIPGNTGWGAQFFDAAGYLYAYTSAAPAAIYRIDPVTQTGVLFAPDAEQGTNLDGARCPNAPVPVDFGDAVNGYGTTLASNGARHGIPGHDSATNTAPLMLGDRIDIDSDGVPGASAQGDDTDGVDDEDAVVGPIGLVIGQPTVVPVRVTNDTAQPATLAGWIDLNDDGDFADPGELQRVVVPAGSGLTTPTLTFPAVGAPGDGTFARFRLYPGDVPVANLSPTGPASAGEVEDYTVIGPVPIFLECPNVYALQGASPYNLWQVDTGTGAMTSVGQLDGAGSLNALAVSPDGQFVYAYGDGDVWVHDTYTGVSQNFNGPVSGTMTHGAVDLSTGFYYFGTVTTTGATIYGFDPSTNTSLGVVANVDWDIDAAGGNGDMAFDSQGNVYIVAGTTATSALYVVSDPLPTTGPAQARSGQRIATIDPAGNAINGMAFDGTGYLYVASGANILQLNPSTGATVNTEAMGTAGSVDLASCSSPASITVQKDVVGRFAAGNQFQVSVTGGGISQNNTGTTTGTDTGIQDTAAEVAGPVLGLPGTAYTIGEVGTGGTDLANYDIEWECVNEADGDDVVASGTGASGTFTMPASAAGTGAAVVCTITNAPIALDFGDAPASYGTISLTAPRHALPGLTGTTAPVMLGASVDGEANGQPNAAATGDGADEDGVDFNASLGYPNPTLRTGTDPVTGLPVVNTLDVEASADGFVSVWVDWNQDGDFGDPGEQVANAAAVTAGTNPITFPQGTNPPGIDTYVRVRYSTDAASVASPTGFAPDGEVEDYAVLIERLNPPQVCTTDDGERYAFTFTTPTRTGIGGVGSTARFSRVSVIEGVPVDMFVEVVAGDLRQDQLPPNGLGVGDVPSGIGLDDARWQVATDATLRYTFYEAGTTTPVPVSAAFTVNDMDGNVPPSALDEIATFSAADLAAYGVSQGSGVQITTPGSDVEFRATTAGAGTITQRFQFVIEGISTFDVDWHGFNGSGFGFDGDGDLSIQPVGCEDYGDAPDSYGTTAAANGPAHTVTDELYMGSTVEFDPNGQPTPGADGDDTNRIDDEDGPTADIAMTPGTGTSVIVDVVNTTGGPATLAGWIDLDGNGTFDAGELVSVPVAASGPYTLTFPAGTATADTYARFRLYPGTPTGLVPTGPAAGGEVEDHLVEVFTTEIDKTVGSVVANADGTHTVTYEIDVTRTGDGGPYDLDDVFMVGSAVDVVGPVTATNTAPGGITTRPEFDGESDLRIVEDVPIADGVTHTYEVTVVVQVDPTALTFENSNCTIEDGEAGTGFMNRATATVGDAATSDDECRPISVPTHEKTVSAGPTPQGSGVYRLDYEIVVTNVGGAAAEYDLEDELQYGDAVNISGTPIATNTSPGTIVTEADWDGEGQPVIVADEPIAAGAAGAPTTHTYSVVVFFTIDAAEVTVPNSDCTLGSGEDGTGLLNETTLRVDEREENDEACPPFPAVIEHDKDVVSGPTPLGNGRYEVEYEIVVTNISPTAGTYDLADELQYGDAVTIEAGPTLTPPAGVTPLPGWDGQGNTSIVTGQALGGATAAGPATHVYTVRVEVSVDAAEATPGNMDCTLDPGEPGTGLLNTATLTTDGEDTDDDACPPPPPAVAHDKVVSSGPTPVGGGLWEVEYTITVTNGSETAGEYDLVDAFDFGGAIAIDGDPTVTVDQAGITPNPAWNGQDQTSIVTDQAIAGDTTHTYTVIVQVSIDEDLVTPGNMDCTVDPGEDGTGLLNESEMTTNGVPDEEQACPPPIPVITHDKDVVSGPTPLGNGNYEVLYEITVSNATGTAGEYDLSDTLQYGEAITIEAGPTLTPPAGVTPVAGWDGAGQPVIADDQPIAAGPTTHVYTVRVEVSVDAAEATPGNLDCTIDPGEDGTGLLNTTELTHNGEPEEDDACPPPPPVITHDKEVVSGPTPIGGGRYEVVYGITVANASPTAGTYDLGDTLHYGDAVNIEAGPTLTPPAGVTPIPGWDGQANTAIVTGQALAGSPATHVYTVRVEISIDGVEATPGNMDCTVDPGEDGTGLLNTATLTVNGEPTDDDACPPPPGIPTHTKEVSSGPTPVGDGLWEVEYTVTVTNDDPTAATYDLVDAFNFGGAISIDGDPTVTVDPVSITPNPAWDGQGVTSIVDDQAIAAGTPADPTVHTYTITVTVAADEDLATPGNMDCTEDPGEDGTGLLNESELTVNGVSDEDDACPPPIPVITHDKDVVSGPTPLGNGNYEVLYEITVTNATGTAGEYDLSDTLLYGDSVVIEAGPTLTPPAGVTPVAGWDGAGQPVIADDQPIAAGPTTHVYQVRVEVSVDGELATPEDLDCTVGPGEDGTGLRNETELTHNGETEEDEACPTPLPSISHDKDVVSGPTAIGGGRYEVIYEILVTNDGGGVGPYDLGDTLTYGEAVNIEAGPTLTPPAGVTPIPGWTGQGANTAIVDDQPLGPGATHLYTVRVEISIDDVNATPGNMDCTLDPGEAGTGLLNTATLTVNGVDDDDDACPEPPVIVEHDKEVSSGPTAVGDGLWEVEYTITVTNDEPGEGRYDLEDAFRFGGSIAIEGDPVVENVTPGDVVTRPDWDGQGQPVIVEDQAIAAGTPADPTVHVYTVTVTVSVDAETVTFEDLDCTLDQGETGTGLLNESTLDVNDIETEDQACPDPIPVIQHDKDVVSGPTAIGGGLYEVAYEIVVTNKGGVGDYDLGDELQYGEAITVVGAPVLTATPASVTPEPDWDGQANTAIAVDEPIDAGTAAGPATHTYTVTVQVRVDADEVTFENGDCTIDPGEDGTGLLNTATLTHNGVPSEDDGCPPPIAAPTHDKEVTSGPTSLGEGRYEIGYTITVANAAGVAGTYDLDDTLRYGDAVTIEGSPVLTAPAGVTPNPAWDGQGETSIVAGQAIEAGASGAPAVHTYTVTVTVQVDGDAVTFENSDCALTDGETGTGFLNESTMTVNEVEDTEQACPPPDGVISHTKEVSDGPTEIADGRYEVEYLITVTNTSSGEGTYDLDDELRYGEGLDVVDATVANASPGDIAVNSGWDGIADVVVVTDQPIDAATAEAPAVHTYVVTVTVDSPVGLDPSVLDCVVDGDGDGTGLNNHSTLTTDGEEHAAAACSEVAERPDPVDPTPNRPGPSQPGSPSGPGRLARTGATIGLLVLVSVALIGAGTALVVDRRRRLRGSAH